MWIGVVLGEDTWGDTFHCVGRGVEEWRGHSVLYTHMYIYGYMDCSQKLCTTFVAWKPKRENIPHNSRINTHIMVDVLRICLSWISCSFFKLILILYKLRTALELACNVHPWYHFNTHCNIILAHATNSKMIWLIIPQQKQLSYKKRKLKRKFE